MLSSIGTSSLAYQPVYGPHAATAVPSPVAAGYGQDLITQQQINKLRATDQKVRQHEQAHLAAAGGLGVGGASFQYARGPDGKNYAVAGEVQIDVSPGRDPKATLEKARRIQAAALAPSDPSPQDLAVAAAAAQLAAQATAELSQQDEDAGGRNDSGAKTAAQASRVQAAYGQSALDPGRSLFYIQA